MRYSNVRIRESHQRCAMHVGVHIRIFPPSLPFTTIVCSCSFTFWSKMMFPLCFWLLSFTRERLSGKSIGFLEPRFAMAATLPIRTIACPCVRTPVIFSLTPDHLFNCCSTSKIHVSCSGIGFCVLESASNRVFIARFESRDGCGTWSATLRKRNGVKILQANSASVCACLVALQTLTNPTVF